MFEGQTNSIGPFVQNANCRRVLLPVTDPVYIRAGARQSQSIGWQPSSKAKNMSKIMRLAVTFTLLVFWVPAVAQNGPVGIAFVQAPEQGGGVATGAAMEKAFAKATAQCMESGAVEADCLKTNWCFPAGWSVDIFVQHREGPHWHEVLCGLPSRAAAEATAVHVCDRSARDYLIECAAVQYYDPQGAAQLEN